MVLEPVTTIVCPRPPDPDRGLQPFCPLKSNIRATHASFRANPPASCRAPAQAKPLPRSSKLVSLSFSGTPCGEPWTYLPRRGLREASREVAIDLRHLAS